jgi:hypothetical protein
MPRSELVALLAVTLALPSCERTIWYRQGATEADCSRDSYECERGRAAERQSGRAAERQSGRAAEQQSSRAALNDSTSPSRLRSLHRIGRGRSRVLRRPAC